jgi:hypothetical protein
MSPNLSIGRVEGVSFPKRDVSSHLIITGRIFRKNSPKVLGVEYHQMVKVGSTRSSAQHIRSARASGTRWADLGCPLLARGP